VLETLEQLRERTDEELRTFHEEHGIPDVGYPDRD